MTPVKDGQLCWAVIAMGTSTLFELWAAVEKHKQMPTYGGLALGGTILVMLPAMLLGAGGAVFSTTLRTASGGGFWGWIRHYKMFVASLIMAVIAAYTYTQMHFAIPE